MNRQMMKRSLGLFLTALLLAWVPAGPAGLAAGADVFQADTEPNEYSAGIGDVDSEQSGSQKDDRKADSSEGEGLSEDNTRIKEKSQDEEKDESPSGGMNKPDVMSQEDTREGDSSGNEPESAVLLNNLVKQITISGRKLVFNEYTDPANLLSSDTCPGHLQVMGFRQSMKLSWKHAKNRSLIDAYIVLRKDGNQSSYRQIARVSKTRSSYEDKKASAKNRLYTYLVIGCRKDGALRISRSTGYTAAGMTSKSRLNNVYKAAVSNKKDFNSLGKGESVKIRLVFPEKPVKRSVVWSVDDTAVVKVSAAGKVTGLKAGTARIRGRLVSGKEITINVHVRKKGTAKAILSVLKSWLSYSEKNKKHRKIIDIYNSYGNLPVGYKVSYRDAWCDTCLSAAAIVSGNVGPIGRECGVLRHISIFKKKGIWIENGSITPKPGYVIVYNWSRSKQPNNSGGTHIGVVLSVKKGRITTIEGNYDDRVKKRVIPVGWGFIRGYAKPRYKK